MEASCLLLEVICYRKDALMAPQFLSLLSRGMQPATGIRLGTMRTSLRAPCDLTEKLIVLSDITAQTAV